jgi:hypothetical protein
MIFQFVDGTKYDIDQLKLKRLFHYVPSLTVERESIVIPGRSGSVPTEFYYGDRTITVKLMYKVADIYDFYLLRDEINAKFAQREPFYIIFKREPWKRWKVSLAGDFTIDPNKQVGEFEVEFICEHVFAESVGTCRDLVKRDFDSALWGWGSGIDSDIEYAYTFSDTRFTVHNIGTAAVDVNEGHELIINVRGAFPNGFSFTNADGNCAYRYTGTVADGEVITMRNFQTFKNGISDFKNAMTSDTMQLVPGENEFIFYEQGGSLESIAFDFRFYYK